MEQIKITDLRTIQYSAKGKDWSFTVGRYVPSIDSDIYRIYLDDAHLHHTGIERYIIEVFNNRNAKVLPWRIVQFSNEGANVIELKL